MKYIRFIHISFLLAVTCLLAGCRDDALGDFGDIEEGVASVSVKLSWDRGDEVGIDSRAGDPGDLIQDIKSLYMFIYDKDGNLYKDRYYKVTDENGTHDTELKNVSVDNGDNREDSEKGENGLGDALQGRAQFDMELNRGEYYIYAVANVDVPALDKEKYSTRDKLKAISFNWDPTHTENNSQMFGIFSLNTPNRKATDAAPLRINAKSVMIHSWVRRLASKVTVAFDGSELYDNVQVYIKTITIHDIPQSCTLGNENHPGGSELAPKDRYSVLHKTGKTITVQEIPEGTNYITPATFLHVCNSSHPYLGKGDESTPESVKDEKHEHESESLFFYENMQGTGKSKKQSQDGTHIDFDNPVENDIESGWKDNKPFGTYIEVVGFYRCVSADGSMGSGPIKYRYMLGKGDTDYNAERNTHYKLTLKLKGYGNDYDWHIDYQTTPGLHVTNPLYISYLYNKRMNATVKMVGNIPDNYVLHAEIVECSWKPYSDGSVDFPTIDKVIDEYGHEQFRFYQKNESDPGPWNSFLSLRQDNVVKIEVPGTENKPSNLTDWTHMDPPSYNRQYYNDHDLGSRDYDVSEGQHDTNTAYNGVYNVAVTKRNSAGDAMERIFTIPIYTRPKELVTRSAFSGNNPFYSYPRHGKIRFSVVHKTTRERYESIDPVDVDIIQVRRILNPKGVWRSAGSNDNFHVRLMRLPKPEAPKFESFTSIGKWSAEVVMGSDHIITLSSTVEGSGEGNMEQKETTRIEGESEHPIDFYINFNGTSGCAIVKIRYHNYSCEHDIFVREGYDPIDIAGLGDQKWSSYNVDHFEKDGDGYKAIPTTSPIAEGSLFRRTSPVAILQSNNDTYPRFYEVKSTDKYAVHDPDSNITEMTWEEIIAKKKGNFNRWDITNGNDEHIASGADLYDGHLISRNANDQNFPIAKSYGIVYADGATETKENVIEATGFNGSDNSWGMMGVIVYNKNTCAQIFFPLGSQWHGHRKGGVSKDKDGNITGITRWGIMRYAGRDDIYPDNQYLPRMPLFYDLYERPGCVYWLRDRQKPMSNYMIDGKDQGYPDASKSCALDMNFYTMSFEGYNTDAADANGGEDSHACFIRTVFSKH